MGSTPTPATAGCWSNWDDAGFACRQSGFESPAVHSLMIATGSWSNGTTLAWRAGNPGSTPGGSTDFRKVAGYGSPGRFAKPCGCIAVRVQLPCLPLLDGEMDDHGSLRTSRSGFESRSGYSRLHSEGPPEGRREPVGSRRSFTALRVRLPLLPLSLIAGVCVVTGMHATL